MKKLISKCISSIIVVVIIINLCMPIYALSSVDELIRVAMDQPNNNYTYETYNGTRGAWCADFVSWCAREAMVPTDIIPTTPSCDVMYNTITNNGTKNIVFTPQAGDLLFYKNYIDDKQFAHVGIMVDETWSVQGNINDTVYYMKPLQYIYANGQDSTITDIVYVRPEYDVQLFEPLPEKSWDKLFGGSSYDNLFSVEATKDGGFIVAGISMSSATGNIDDISNHVVEGIGFDGLIAKFNSNGIKEWDNLFGGSSSYDVFNDVIQTIDGGYVAIGYSRNPPGLGELTDINNGSDDGLIVKFNHNGDIVWHKLFGGIGREEFTSVIQTEDGSYIVVGSSIGSSNSGDIIDISNGYADGLIAKYDESGNLVWNFLYGGIDYDRFSSVCVIEGGGFIVSGYTCSRTSGDIASYKNSPDADGLIIRFDEDGNKQWEEISDLASLANHFYSCILTSDNCIVVLETGSTYKRIIKYSVDGDLIWKKSLNTEITELFNIVETANNCFLLIGNATSTISDGVIIKTNSAGVILDEIVFGGEGSDRLKSITENKFGNIIVVGYSRSSLSGDITDINKGYEDGLIVQFGSSLPAPTVVDCKSSYNDNEDVVINWTPSKNANKYYVEIINAYCQEGIPDYYYSSFTELTSINLGTTLPVRDYMVTVTPYNDTLKGPESDLKYFSVLRPIPGSTTVTISEQAYTNYEDVIINWESATNADHYLITLTPKFSTSFVSRWVTVDSLTNCNLGILDAGEYELTVTPYYGVPFHGGIEGPESDDVDFTVTAPLPESVTINMRTGFNPSDEINIQWNESIYPDTKYDLYIWDDDEKSIVFQRVIEKTDLSDVSYKIPAFELKEGNYLLGIISYNKNGTCENTSYKRFAVDKKVLAISILSFPCDPYLERGDWVGKNYSGLFNNRTGHIGIDYRAVDLNIENGIYNAEEGVPVFPVANGVVDYYNATYGWLIIKHTEPLVLEDPNNIIKDETHIYKTWYTSYAHMDNIPDKLKKVGAKVYDKNDKKKTILGKISNVSPDTIAVHLHFSIFTDYLKNSTSNPDYNKFAISPLWVKGLDNAAIYTTFLEDDGSIDQEAWNRLYENISIAAPANND